MYKQKSELETIQEAIDITGKALKLVKDKISECEYEYQVEALINQVFTK